MSQAPTSTQAPASDGPTGLLPAALPDARRGKGWRRPGSMKASDHLPAFLVKEVRQSLRSRRFMRSFIGLQFLLQIASALMLVQVSGYLEAVGSDFTFERQLLNSLFWLAVATPLLIVPPLTIMASMGRILKDRSLDLVFMTGLTAWRAVIGIWLSYLAEGLLLTLASLPYVVLRYFLGGVDMYSELCLFVLVLGMSGLITAITLGLPTYRHIFVRLIIIVLAIMLGLVGSGWLKWVVSDFDPSSMWHWQWGVFLFLMLPLLGFIFLRLAASHLCPPAESHSAWLRLGSLVLLILSVIVQVDTEIPAILLCVIFITPLLTEGLCEPFRPIAPLFTPPGARLGFLRRLGGRLLYAGWPAGLHFVFAFYVLLTLSCLLHLGLVGESDERPLYALRLAAGQALTILGAALFHRLRNPLKDPTQGFFGIVFILQFLYMMLVMMLSGVFNDSSHVLVYLAPIAGSLRVMDSGYGTPSFIAYYLYPLAALICYLLLAALAAPHWRATRALERGEIPSRDAPTLPPSLVDQRELT